MQVRNTARIRAVRGGSPRARVLVVVACLCALLATQGLDVATPRAAAITDPPSVAAVSPSGPSAGGTSVSITGANFTGASAVRFGTVPASGFTVISDGLTTATAPAGSTTVDVTITGPAGTSALSPADEYTYTFSNNGYAIGLSASTPAPAVGSSVVLTATANQDVGPTPYGMSIMDVTTGGEVIHTGSGSTLSTSVGQSSAGTHRYVACVCNGGGINAQATSSPVVVTWGGTAGPPAVTGVSPNSGTAAGGTSVIITGTGFAGASGVTFGAAGAASFTVTSDSRIAATSPAGVAGAVDVRVTTPSGTSAAVAADQYTYLTPPTITGLSPTSGPAAGGTVVTITGTGFATPVAPVVRFGSVTATSVTVNSPSSITAMSPAVSGTVEVSVTTPSGRSPSGRADWFTYTGGVSVPAFDHVFTIIMENAPYNQIIGNTAQAPYLNSLAAQYGLATNYFGVAHPSMPNYLALTGGTTFGVTTDCTTCFQAAPNIAVDRVEASGRTWKTYQESMANNCTTTDSGLYTVRHDPFVYYDNIRTSSSECAKVVPMTGLASDLASTSTTPNYAWVTPNLCNDMHDCPISTGDAWLRQNVPAILNAPAFTDQSSVLFITWDEDDEANANHIVTLAIGNNVVAGTQSATVYTHYSLLKTIETAWNLPPLSSGDAAAQPMSDLFVAQARPPPTVLGISPSSGPAGGGTAVTINGANLGTATAVMFGASGTKSFTVNGAGTAIIATSPPSVAGTVDITVTTPQGTSATGPADRFTYVGGSTGPPSVTGVSPIWGPSTGGTSVVIAGTNLNGATSVQFGSVAATSYTVSSASSITALAPAGTTTVDVTVTTPQGTSATGPADQYTYTFSNNGYAIGLSAAMSSPAVGTSVVLTATANKDVGPTPYGMSIFDVTTGTELIHVGSGSTVSVGVVQPTATTHRYVACVCNGAGANAQAVSTPLLIGWH